MVYYNINSERLIIESFLFIIKCSLNIFCLVFFLKWGRIFLYLGKLDVVLCVVLRKEIMLFFWVRCKFKSIVFRKL